jgi:hypothetical protein
MDLSVVLTIKNGSQNVEIGDFAEKTVAKTALMKFYDYGETDNAKYFTQEPIYQQNFENF